jgi:hypothetical protein
MNAAAPITLIQLVSEQTMQNLLPVLRLRPARLVHLATPRTSHRSAHIADAARQSQCPVELETITLSAMPGMRESMQATLGAVENAGASGQSVILNFTGGTKLMGIGAYVAALRHKIPSLYVDTQDSVFVDGQTAPGLDELLAGDFSFTPLQRGLSVNAIARANGCGRVTAGRDCSPWSELARHLHGEVGDEEHCHRAINGSRTARPLLDRIRLPADWLRILDTDIPLPRAVSVLALASGQFRPGMEPDSVRLPDRSRADLTELGRLDGTRKVPDFLPRLIKASAPLQDAANFLGGAWWEVIVAERMKACGRFRDLRWSVQVGEQGGPDLEEDIVALEGVRVVYVSCKRSSQGGKLLPQLEQINARAAKLGGAFNRRFLAIRQKPRGRTLANLTRRAEETGVRLIFSEDLDLADPFT